MCSSDLFPSHDKGAADQKLIDFIEKKFSKLPKFYDEYSKDDIEAITKLKETKYSLDSWNYGKSPSYTYSKVKKFPAGLIEIYLQVEKGKIEEIKIFGDYFFNKETEELENLIKGCNHSHNQLTERVEKINLSDYISNIEREEFLSLFWE